MFDDYDLGSGYYDSGPSTIDYEYEPSPLEYDYAPEDGGIIDTYYDNASDYNYGDPLYGTPYETSTYDAPLSPLQQVEMAAYGGQPASQVTTVEAGRGGGSSGSGSVGGSSDSKVMGLVKGLFTDKGGDFDLKKIMTAVQGLGGLYQAYRSGKNNPLEKKLTPVELAATLPQQKNQQWTPQQQIWADKFFNESIPGVKEGDRRLVRAGEGGIKSIMPSRGYASGGTVATVPDIDKLLRQLYSSKKDGPVPLVPELSLPQLAARIRVHGGGGDMAEGGEVQGPLSHGNYGLVAGAGDGQSDMVPINASPGEYVFDAETVSMLGNGSNDAGADILDKWREFLREHKRSASPDEIGPESLDPNAYLPGEE